MKKFALLLVGLTLPLATHGASTINTTNAYAWGANIGWTNWRPSAADGVVIGEFICSGYVYGANVGWINIGNGIPTNHIQYSNTSSTDFGVNYGTDSTQPGYGILRGYAYGANIGWINFEATGNPRVRFSDGALEGYAYSANCGWINLGDPTEHNLKTDSIAMGLDSDGNGVADAWEYLYFGHLLGAAANQDTDGDGMTDLQEYLEGTNPLLAGDRLRIVSISTNSGGTSSPLTWTSTVGRLYAIDTATVLSLSPPTAWTDSGLGTIYPDAGTQTTRAVTEPTSTKRFFRIRAIRPLP
jgi:hypothetical protein